jgi:tetratricopeptide (TPR) repeat protein
MRTPIALAICVSLIEASTATVSFAEGPVAANKNDSEWTVAYKSGLAAGQRHDNEEARAIFEQAWGTSSTPLQRGAAANGVGVAYGRLGRTNEAKEWLERARQAFGADPRLASRLAATVMDLADLHRTAGDYGTAEHLLRDVLASPSCSAESTCDVQSRGFLLNNLGDLLREEGRTAEAQPLFKESIDLAISNLGTSNWRQRVGALIGLADIGRQEGEWADSIKHWNEAIEICHRERDEKSEAIAIRGLGVTWLHAGSAARAEPLLRRSLRIMEDNPGLPAEELASTHSGLAELYRSENKLAMAEDEWSRALRIDQVALGNAHPQVAVLMEMLSEVYSARGEPGQARDYAMRASDTMTSSFGENSMPVATALLNQALVEERAGDLGGAAKHYERAIGIARFHPEHRPLQAVMIRRYAGLLKTMHRSREAKALLANGDTEGQRALSRFARVP